MNDKDKKIPSKFKEVSGFSFTTYGGELMIVFSGFEDEKDLPEFADFIFKKIKNELHKSIGPEFETPTIH